MNDLESFSFHKILYIIKAAILLVLIGLNSEVSAQCRIGVTIIAIDAESEQPVIGYEAAVGNQYGFGDANGHWQTQVTCNGTQHIHVISKGYEPLELDYILGDRDTILKFKMTVSKTRLDDIEVIAHRKPVVTTNAMEAISEKEILNKAGSNLGEMLQSINGIEVIKTGTGIGKPILHGMHSNRLLILNNGIRQEGQQWGMEHGPEIDPFNASSIVVIKGAESVRYGAEAIGGVILLLPSDINHTKVLSTSAYMQAQSNGKGGSTGVKIDGNLPFISGLQYAVHGSGKIMGNFKAPNYYLENTGLREYNGSARLKYKREHADYNLYYSQYYTDIGILSSSHIGSLDDLKYALENGRPANNGIFTYDIGYPRQQISHGLLKADAHVHLSDFIHLHSIYAWQKNNRKEYDKRRAGLSTTPSLDLTIHTHTWDNYLEYYDGYNWILQGGVNFLHQNNYSSGHTFSTPLIPDYFKNEYGIFGLAKYSKGLYSLEFGARVAYQQLKAAGYRANGDLYGGKFDFVTYASNIGYAFKPNNIVAYGTNIGLASRAPNVNELFASGLHHGTSQMEYGDSTLNQEKSIKWMHQLQYKPSEKFRISVDGFIQYYVDYIYLKPLGTIYSSLRGVFPEYKYKHDDALFYGGDIAAKWEPYDWISLESALNITLAQSYGMEKYLPLIPPIGNDNRISIKAKSWKWIKNPTLIINNINRAKQSRWSAANEWADPPNGYSLFNVGYENEWLIRGNQMKMMLSVDNLLNTSYKDYLNRYRLFAHETGRNLSVCLTYQF